MHYVIYQSTGQFTNVLIKASHIKTLQQVIWKMYIFSLLFVQNPLQLARNCSNALSVGFDSATKCLS